jgi:hypothetical protein
VGSAIIRSVYKLSFRSPLPPDFRFPVNNLDLLPFFCSLFWSSSRTIFSHEKVTKDAGLYIKMSERSHVIVVLYMRVRGSILVHAVEREVKKYSIDERICV